MRKQTAECAPQNQGGGRGSVHTVIFPVCLKVFIVKSWEILKETEIYQPEIGKKEEVAGDPLPEALSSQTSLAWPGLGPPRARSAVLQPRCQGRCRPHLFPVLPTCHFRRCSGRSEWK